MSIDLQRRSVNKQLAIALATWPRSQGAGNFARVVSDLINPIFVMIATIVLAGCYATYDLGRGLVWTTTALLTLCILPAAYVVVGVRRGTLSGLHLSKHSERKKPIAISLVSAALGTSCLVVLGATPLFLAVIYSALLTSVALALCTILWKISFHCASVTGMVVTALWLLGGVAIFLLLLIPLVAWSRVRLGAHTIGQVLAGASVAALVTTLVLMLVRLQQSN